MNLETSKSELQTYRSSILIYKSLQLTPKDVDVDHISKLKPFEKIGHFYKVICLHIKNFDSTIKDLLDAYKERNFQPKIILLVENNLDSLYDIIKNYDLYRVFKNDESIDLDTHLLNALESYNESFQEIELQKIVNEQNIKLKLTSTELEEQIQKRENKLNRSRQRLLNTNQKIEALNKVLIAVHQSLTIAELEKLLNEALAEVLKLEWIRFFFKSQTNNDSLPFTNNYSVFSADINSGETVLGHIYFARKHKSPFKKDEIDFLNQVAESVSLALDRISKLDESESLKQQWEATFDAITEPLCLTNKSFEIIKTNKAFSKVTGKSYEKLIGKNCFKSFLGTDFLKNNENISAKSVFRVHRNHNNHRITYEVNCQKIVSDNNIDSNFILILFRDITEQLKLEKRLLESSKMAELGTIGSSIAHEINNPLGGMISFLQLIKMDITENDDIYSDIIDMEVAAKRCKDIVENLLGFSRKNSTEIVSDVDLREVVQQSLKITEIKTRSQGINVEISCPNDPVLIQGEFNLLAQAVRNLLQNAQESISEQLQIDPQYDGQIRVEVKKDDNKKAIITVTDNGMGMSSKVLNKVLNPLFTTKNPSTNSGLGLTLVFKIVEDHQGELEFFSQPKIGTSAKISF